MGSNRPRRLIVTSRASHPLDGAGSGSAADATIRFAGGVNVLAKQQGYKPLAGEAAAAQAPDVIVTPRMSMGQFGSVGKLLAMPGSAATPAARNKRVVVMDDLLLGFGPRLPEVLAKLMTGFGGKTVGG
ncbi:ABC transporter substrate-binding protein [Chitinolyticbacter albus]|uniref:ABC transporter substrate-binding protein n=1 Tax=Chitinolyticbacter albus TaxID=2961951 RepID=UPI00210C9F85|nr:ABC transporter substrate-binding protein [Chitinolyticbacter albus]